MKLFSNKWMKKVVIFGIVIVYLLLIFKDPFSKRILIPNFEPQPDTFHYINPAISFVEGKGFNINREGRALVVNVPPLYSFSLIPVFFINPDPRMAYYTNVFLALASLLLFWLILKRLFVSKLVIYILLILYITNYYIYWVPTIIMAENLTLTLYLATLYFFLSKTTILNLILVTTSAIGLYATKYANIPVTATVVFLSFGKILLSKVNFKGKIKLTLIILSTLIIAYLFLQVIEQNTKGRSIVGQYYEHIRSIYLSFPDTALEAKKAKRSKWFGYQFVSKHFPMYIDSLVGKSNRFLWDNKPLLPSLIAIGGLIGILLNIFIRKFRFISFVLLSLLFSSVIFMSTFYSFDARYIYIAIPTLLLGFGLLLNSIENKIFIDKKTAFNILIVFFICVYLFTNFNRIKSQISLNLKYAETPWYYIAILKMNEYFTEEKVIGGKKPVVISALAPFLIDYYSNGNYILLPLSYEQEFRDVKEIVWGPNDYSNLPNLYRKYLEDGFDVYVSRAGLGNEGYTNRDFNIIVKEFDTELVLPGCFDQCNIYRVRLK